LNVAGRRLPRRNGYILNQLVFIPDEGRLHVIRPGLKFSDYVVAVRIGTCSLSGSLNDHIYAGKRFPRLRLRHRTGYLSGLSEGGRCDQQKECEGTGKKLE